MRFASLLLFLLSMLAIGAAQDTNFSDGPQYLMNYGSPLFLHPIATPTLSLDTPRMATRNAPAEEHTGTPDTAAVGEFRNQAQVNWIYWGASDVTLNRLSTAQTSPQPRGQAENTAPIALETAPLFDVGVTGFASTQLLREGGYGAPLGDIATYWKNRHLRATHVYTNADIARLSRGQVSP